MFDLNFGLFVWTSIVFLALLGILWKFAWGPVLAAVDAREQKIQAALDRAAAEREEAAKLLAEHREQMADARRKAQQLIAEGREGGEKVRQDIEDKARVEGQALIERAREAIEQEKESAIEALRREAVDLAIAAAGRLMEEKLDGPKDRELVMGYIEELGRRDEGAQA
ncbi:MAG: F0F1 ATP synthase subunit B [Gemmatimonadota bacterium]